MPNIFNVLDTMKCMNIVIVANGSYNNYMLTDQRQHNQKLLQVANNNKQ